ncbi:hypothetical protein ACP70R_042680 [Stipagrostis hirtigluma subsp. patula]
MSQSRLAAVGSDPPLAMEVTYHSGCPGCRVDKRKAERAGKFPFAELALIWIVTICSKKIRDLHIAKAQEDIGF